MDGAGQQHYLAGHDRLEALVHQLDADSSLDPDTHLLSKIFTLKISQ